MRSEPNIFSAEPGPIDTSFGVADPLSIDIRATLRRFWLAKWILLFGAAVGCAIAFIASLQLSPTYRATGKVMFDPRESNVIDAKEVLARNTARTIPLQNEIEILSSSILIDRVIADLSLAQFPEFNVAIKEQSTPLIDRIFHRAQAAQLDPSAPETHAPFDIIRKVSANLRLRPITGSNVIEISFESEDPRVAADVVNTLAKFYIEDQVETKLEATRSATTWLTHRVDDLQKKLEAAENAVEAARSEAAAIAGQGPELTRQKLQAMTSNLAVLRTKTSEARTRAGRLSEALTQKVDLGAVYEFRASREMQLLRARKADIELEIAALTKRYNPDHQDIELRRAQLSILQQEIADEAQRIVLAAQTEHGARQTQLNELEAEFQKLDLSARTQSQATVAIRQLEREADASRILYENFLSRLKETTEQEDLQTADARILSFAFPPPSPTGEMRQRLLLLGAMLGTMFALALVFVRENLDDTFKVPSDLEDVTRTEVIGVIPKAPKQSDRNGIIAQFRRNPKSSMAEAVRSLRTHLIRNSHLRAPQVVMFTSSVPREGKSTTAMLTALTSRQMGKATLLLDCDLRLPAVAAALDTEDHGPGLLSVLDGRAAIEDAIWKDPDTGLHVLMTRPHEPGLSVNAADVLASKRFSNLIEELRSWYDLIILDTPPVLIVADAQILAPRADAIAYTVAWNSTPRGAVLDGIRELELSGGPQPGMVLTLVDEEKASRYDSNGKTYYRGQHRAYFEAV